MIIEKKVHFLPVEILSDMGNGYWIKIKKESYRNQVLIITQGNEYVMDGEEINFKLEEKMFNKLLNFSKLILTILFFLISFGFYQYNTLPKESDPDISLPVIYISLSHKGISPGDSERILVKPVEKELKNIEGLKKLHPHPIKVVEM